MFDIMDRAHLDAPLELKIENLKKLFVFAGERRGFP
jgi:hypothetical protein